MHRRTDLWGPDGMHSIYHRPPHILIHNWTKIPALEFDPDRFLDERLHKYLTPNPFIFLPFNAGPRICLGQQVYIIHHSSLREACRLTLRSAPYVSSPTMKPLSSSCGSCRTSLPSPLRPMLNLLIPVPRQIGQRIRKEGKGGRRFGREPIWRCMYRYVWFLIFFLLLAELWSVVDYFNPFCFIGRALG